MVDEDVVEEEVVSNSVTKKRRDDVKGQMNSEKEGYLGREKSEHLVLLIIQVQVAQLLLMIQLKMPSRRKAWLKATNERCWGESLQKTRHNKFQ